MIKLDQYIPLHLCIFLSLGIILGYHFPVSFPYIFLSVILLFLSLYWLWKMGKKYLFQGFSYFLIAAMGMGNMVLQFPENQSKHFIHFDQPNLYKIIQIESVLKSNPYQERYFGTVIQMGAKPTQGKIAVIVQRDSNTFPLKMGQLILVHSSFSPLLPPKNPHTFDYARYLRNQGIYTQINIKNNEILHLQDHPKNLKIKAGLWRTQIQNTIQKYPFGKDEMSIINALVLGDKQFISKDVQGNYAAAGTVHILAVSGLHIGIIFMILSFLLKPLHSFKHGKLIVGILIISLLWIYALITGMSGSVVRSVTMFSFITVGMLVNHQKSSILYALFTSYLLLLLIYPLYIFDVGFQLSYLAVLGIVLIQPKLNEIFPKKIKVKLIKNIWQLITVSIAATIVTLPLSLYYFHQFPGLFILSNVVIVPAMGLILGVGLLVVFLANLNILPNTLVYIYDYILYLMNQFMAWIAHQEAFLFKEIPFTLTDTWVSYLVLIMGLRWITLRKTHVFFTLMTSLILLQAVFIYEKWQMKNSSELIVFHKSKATLIGIKNAEKWQVLHTSDTLLLDKNSFLNNYKTALHLEEPLLLKIKQNILKVDEKSILVIDSIGVYQNLKIKPQYILLTQSSKINLERLIQLYKPQKVIADGSNYPYLIQKWKQTCERFQIPFHYTGTHGAFILN
jgi:competence protein ComEC